MSELKDALKLWNEETYSAQYVLDQTIEASNEGKKLGIQESIDVLEVMKSHEARTHDYGHGYIDACNDAIAKLKEKLNDK